MIIDYSSLDSSIRNTVQIIEAKPHVRYIRYLLTKRYSPIVIKKELQRLALSAPHEQALEKYYFAVIDPLVKKHKLGAIYGDYKNKLTRKAKRGAYHKELLSYNLHMGDSPDLQMSFCKFVTELEVDEIWVTEIMRFYGSASNVPLDESGQRVIKTTSYKRRLDTILTCPKRYLIDKMLIENLSDSRISDYCRKKLKLAVYDYDISHYRKVFFNIKTYDIEEKIHALEAEQNALKSFIETLESSHDLELGEKLTIKSQTEKRLKELEDNIKTLNMYFSEFAFGQAKIEANDFMDMFQDVVKRSYSRFTKLDNYNDRDIVDPLFKVAKMMGYAFDKVNELLDQKNSGDKHAQFELMKLYRHRADELYAEQVKSNETKDTIQNAHHIDDDINIDNIEGVDELGIMASEENGEEKMDE